jgi:hypothetical protein
MRMITRYVTTLHPGQTGRVICDSLQLQTGFRHIHDDGRRVWRVEAAGFQTEPTFARIMRRAHGGVRYPVRATGRSLRVARPY